MSWDAVAAVGELLSALAVLASLIYLATQIRQNTQAVSTAATQSALENVNEALRVGASSRQNGRVVFVGQTDFDELDDDEKSQFVLWVATYLRALELAHIHFEKGLIDPGVWSGLEAQLTSFLGAPAVSQIWEVRQQMFGRRFRDLVETLRDRQGVAGMGELTEALGLGGKRD